MKYFEIPDEPDAVIWQRDDGNSGVVREPSDGWSEYLLWLAAGNTLGSLVPVDTRPLEQLRTQVLTLITQAASHAFEPVTSLYPRAEIDSWPEQCSEAHAWLADPSAPTPLTDAIYGVTSLVEKRGFCEAILSKADDYKATVGAVIAWRRATSAWVEAQQERTTLLSFTPRYPEVPDAS